MAVHDNNDERPYFLTAVLEFVTLLYPEEWAFPQEIRFPQRLGNVGS
jgi:hypothetical protein